MPFSDIVKIDVSLNAGTKTATGYGIPIVLSATTLFTERVRWYTSLAGMVTDGFSVSGPEYLSAQVAFSQNPRPPKVGVARLANRPLMSWAITPIAANLGVYNMTFDGHAVTYTADGTATASEIALGLKAAIDALSLAGVTTSESPTGTLRIVGAAGAWHTAYVAPSDYSKLGLVQDTADVGMAADLAAIALENSSWYTILNPYASKALALLVAAYAEANRKTYLADTQDSTLPSASTADTATALAAYARTAPVYHPKAEAMLAAGMAGARLPYPPGSETWKFIQVKGVTDIEINDTQRSYVFAKHANLLYQVGGKNITAEGTMADGTFIDLVRGRDWQEDTIQNACFDALTQALKVPYTDEGAAIVGGAVRNALKLGVRAGFLAANPAPEVIVAKVADQNPTDKANRYFPGITFTATTAAAFHSVGISGQISV